MESLRNVARVLALSTVCWAARPAALAATFTANPAADAFVATGPTGNLADNNYGGGGALVVAAPGLPGGEFQTVMQFDLSAAAGTFNALYGAGGWSIQSVSLQLTASPHGNAIYNPSAAGQFGVSLMQNNNWVEGTGNASNPTTDGITYNQLVNLLINPATDQDEGTFGYNGQTSSAAVYHLPVGPALSADILSGSDATLRLFATDNVVSYLLNSRTTTPLSGAPELIITVVPEPGGVGLAVVGWLAVARARRPAPGRRLPRL
jgi:hypothetical protein